MYWCHRFELMWKSVTYSVMSDPLRLHGLQLTSLLCPWSSLGKNIGVGCHSLLQGIFLTQGSRKGKERRSVMSDSLRPHRLQHARAPCLSPTPRVSSNSCPLNWWCHPTISSSVIPSPTFNLSICSQSTLCLSGEPWSVSHTDFWTFLVRFPKYFIF